MSRGNCDVYSELCCLLRTVMFIGNCDVCRELVCLHGPVISTGKFCRYSSNIQRNICLECYYSLRQK
jgi:hypothetical protein